jgi:hypothetical protein
MDGANVCRQEEVRLQHHPVDHHHRRRPPRARLFRARPAPLIGGGVRTTRRGAFWGASSLGSRTVRYEVRVSDGSRFKLEQDEELKFGGTP